MLQVKQHSPFPALTTAWSAPEEPATEAHEPMREALAAVRPDDLSEVVPLVDSLLARLADGGRRASARRALFALLDGVRRRSFAELLRPDAVAPWVKLVLRVIHEADYAFGDLLR